MTKTVKDSLWDESLDEGLKLAKQAKAKEARLLAKSETEFRNFLRNHDWVQLGGWDPKLKTRTKITMKRGV